MSRPNTISERMLWVADYLDLVDDLLIELITNGAITFLDSENHPDLKHFFVKSFQENVVQEELRADAAVVAELEKE